MAELKVADGGLNRVGADHEHERVRALDSREHFLQLLGGRRDVVPVHPGLALVSSQGVVELPHEAGVNPSVRDEHIGHASTSQVVRCPTSEITPRYHAAVHRTQEESCGDALGSNCAGEAWKAMSGGHGVQAKSKTTCSPLGSQAATPAFSASTRRPAKQAELQLAGPLSQPFEPVTAGCCRVFWGDFCRACFRDV